jgi:hypothetical protein
LYRTGASDHPQLFPCTAYGKGMKTVAILLVILSAVLAGGCTATAPVATEPTAPALGTPPAIPVITGSWAGTMSGYDDGKGINAHSGDMALLVISQQEGRIFAGNITVIEDGRPSFTGRLAGAIGRDGRSLTIVEESGYCTGEIIAADEIELVYMDDATPFTIAIDSFKKAA